MTAVLDASALLALIYREPGHDRVAELLDGEQQPVVSTVNWAEVVGQLARRGHPDPAVAVDGLRSLGLRVRPFTTEDAVRAGLFWKELKGLGLSLGDRACLAVAAGMPDGVAVTADQAWVAVSHPTVRLIR